MFLGLGKEVNMTIVSLVIQIFIIGILQLIVEFFTIASAQEQVVAEIKRMKAQYPFVVNEYGKKWDFDKIEVDPSMQNEWKWYINKEEAMGFISFWMMHLGVFIAINVAVNLIMISLGLSLMNVIAGAFHIAGPTNDFISLLSFIIPIVWQYITLRRFSRIKPIEDNKYIVICRTNLDAIQKAVSEKGLDVNGNGLVTITSTARKV